MIVFATPGATFRVTEGRWIHLLLPEASVGDPLFTAQNRAWLAECDMLKEEMSKTCRVLAGHRPGQVSEALRPANETCELEQDPKQVLLVLP